MDTNEPKECHYLTNLLEIHLILREIAKYLALRDLMSCSVVNREWCGIFRTHIWEYCTCNIRLAWLEHPCRQLKDLNALLTNSRFALPFNGIVSSDNYRLTEVFWKNSHPCPAANHEDMSSDCYDTFLSKVRFTSLEIFFPYTEQKDGEVYPICPAIRCMKNIISLNAPELKKLSIRQTPQVGSFLDYFEVDVSLRPGWLGKLETLVLASFRFPKNTLHAQEILESSPNLKAIIGKISRWLIEGCPWDDHGFECYIGIVPTKKYSCIKEACALTASQLLKVAEEKPQLKYLNLYKASEWYTFELFGDKGYEDRGIAVKALNILFRSSFSSLRVIGGAIFQLAVLSREVETGSWPLRNVSTLELTSTYQELSYFKYMNLSLMFPNLSQISIHSKNGDPSNLDPNLLSYESDFDYADSTIQNLHLYDLFPEEYLRSIESAFPNITGFTYHNCSKVKEMCEALWKMNWEKLRLVNFCSVPINFDVEDAFFALPREERELIDCHVGLDGGYFHHVPSKYSAFNFQNLKTIQLDLEECRSRFHYYSDGVNPIPYPCNEIQASPVISRIAAQKISQRLPGLEMEILIEPGNLPADGALITQDACKNTLPQIPSGFRFLQSPGPHNTTCPCAHKHRFHNRADIDDSKKWKFTVSFK